MIDFNFREAGEYIDTDIDIYYVGSESLGLLDKKECESLLEDLVRSTEDLVHLLYGEWVDISNLIDNLDKGD